jgi:NAD(P)-dependent dehydrogenase (short-subunit alcohol dehydrogenase family)
VGRLGRPEDIAAGVAYLASEDSSFVTGTVLQVNGGSLL